MKIIYTIQEDYSLAFNHIFEDDYILKDGEFEISQEDFDKLFEVGGDIRLNPLTNKIDIVPVEVPSGIIRGVFNPKKWQWEESLSLDEKLQYYRDKMSQVYKKIKEQKEEIEFLGFGEVDQKLYDELEKLKQKHMEVSQEIAIQINNSGTY